MLMHHSLFTVLFLVPILLFSQSELNEHVDTTTNPIDTINLQKTDGDSIPFDSVEWVFEDYEFSQLVDSLIFYEWHSDTDEWAMMPYAGNDSILPLPADSILIQRLNALDLVSPFTFHYNTDVKRFINLYLKRHEMMSRMLGLAEFYFPLFEETLDRYNMPLELKYLSIVESALNARARSRVGAQGLWQFMYNTGKAMGLEVNSMVDERNDPYKSTDAACRYLQSMHKIFGEWDMALAAYNAGPGNVNKAIRRSGGKKTYWEIRPFLPRETQGYVPAFIAVNYVMTYAKEHGIQPTPTMYKYFQVDSVDIRETLTFEILSKTLNIGEEQLEALNPVYRKGIIPASTERYATLVLPTPHLGAFLQNEDSIYTLAKNVIPEKERSAKAEDVERVVHHVRPGESLSVIADKYKVRVLQIKQWNNLRSDRIFVGQRLQLEPKATAPPSSQGATVSSIKVVEKDEDKNAVYHRIQIGDTLYNIAAKYDGINADDIMKWNKISNPKRIRTGDKVIIYL